MSATIGVFDVPGLQLPMARSRYLWLIWIGTVDLILTMKCEWIEINR